MVGRGRQLIDITFIQTLDDLCSDIKILEAADEHRPATSIHVTPEIYEQVAEAKARQHLARGNPLLLLGLDLVRDETLSRGQFRIRSEPHPHGEQENPWSRRASH